MPDRKPRVAVQTTRQAVWRDRRSAVIAIYVTYVALFTLTPFSFVVEPSSSVSDQFDRRFEGLSGAGFTLWDTISNTLFYVPIGYMAAGHRWLTGYSRLRKILSASAALGVLSFGLESAQVFLPRHPSLIDVVCNVVGATFGGFLGTCRRRFVTASLTKAISVRTGHRIAGVALALYLAMLFIIFAVPLPLSAEFGDWKSEFDLSLGNEWEGELSWTGSVYLVSLYQRELHPGEVSTNYLAGPFRDSKLARIGNGLVFLYDFSHNSAAKFPEPASSDLPIRLRVMNPARIEWLNPHGLVVHGTSLIISAEPPIRMAGDRFFAHQYFSVEAWIAPVDPRTSGVARLVSYSPHYPRQKTLTLVQQKREIAVALPAAVSTLQERNPEPRGATIGPAIRHVVVTYGDGVETLYVNGVERAREVRQHKNAMRDALIDFVGDRFKWSLYSAVMFPTGVLAGLFHLQCRSTMPLWLLSLATTVVPLAVIEAVRMLTLGAAVEPFFIVLAVGTISAAVLCAVPLRSQNPAGALCN